MATEKPPLGRTMRAAHSAARTIPNTEIVKAGELVEARFARGVAPSAAARKVLALLIHKAAEMLGGLDRTAFASVISAGRTTGTIG
jgi:hypothetical protein